MRKSLNTGLRAQLVLESTQLRDCVVLGARDVRLTPAAGPAAIAVLDKEMAGTYLGRLVALGSFAQQMSSRKGTCLLLCHILR